MLLVLYVAASVLLIEFALFRARALRTAEAALLGSNKYAAFRRKDTHLWRRWRLYLVGVPLMLPRFLLIVLCVVIHGIVCRLVTLGADLRDGVALSSRRRTIIQYSSVFWSRLLLFSAGFWYIREQGESDPRACVVVCNHSSWVDIIYFLTAREFPSFLANAGAKKMPFVGSVAQAMQCVFVDRGDKANRSTALTLVEDRQRAIYSGAGFPKLLLFPEGTTTNGTGLLYFRKGAFATGVPVQPIALRYPYQHFSPAMDSIPMLPQVVLMCCQVYNTLQVTRLRVMESPNKSPEERAQEAREVLAKELQVPLLADRFEEKFEFLEFAFHKKSKHS